MSGLLNPDVCVVGAGAAGLVVAAAAAQLGLEVVLVERGAMGGDCLNHGCVPSKALIAAARLAQAQRDGGPFGIEPVEPRVDFGRVMAHVAETIAAIAPHDSVERFEALGVRVIRAEARFTGRTELQAGSWRIRSKRIVLATGSRPALPSIPGLAESPHVTNETLFANRVLPAHLVVIGGGPVGLEMAQAHRRLGARVTVLEAGRILSRDDRELVDIVARRLAREGIDIREGAGIARIERHGDGAAAILADGTRLEASHLLVATGRTPTIDGLALDIAGIAHTSRGITVDDRLRTSNRNVWAIGDVNGRHAFTHVAGHEASLFVRGALFRLPARLEADHVAWCTYTDPELARVGLSEAEARARHGTAVRVLRADLADNDRARTARLEEGLVKVVTGPRGRVLGAAIAAPGAGELIQPWCLAVQRGLKVSAMAGFVPPYPTLGEASKRAAGSYYAATVFGPRARRLARLLARLPVFG